MCFPCIHEIFFLYFVLNASTLNLYKRLLIGLMCKSFTIDDVDRRFHMTVLACLSLENASQSRYH